MTITNDNVQLDTNIETEHKPFYTHCILHEKNEFTIIEKNNIQLSASIVIMNTSDMSKKITIILNFSGIIFIKLTKYK
ncbi:hypothetical protein ASG21_15500 [Chryseobacterium sp. Leaf394]|nr:hypothetical protein ASG21_15500 [Chryseobacterium sp. Leaf394]